MLTYLIIKNYTVAEHVELELQTDMTAITGETGAGKSIMIDALELCLGGRSDTKAIRANNKQFEIIAHFSLSQLPQVQVWLENNDLSSDNECIVRRVVKQDGRSLSTINGSSVPLQLTRHLASLLVAIHGQHEHQLLLKRETHREIIDSYAKHQKLLNQVQQHYQQWHTVFSKIEKILAQDSDQTRIDFISYQLRELQELQLGSGELQKLEQEHKLLANSDSLIEIYQQVSTILDGGASPSVSNNLQQALQLLNSLQDTQPRLKTSIELLNVALINAEEANQEIKGYLDNVNMEPQRLQELELRLQKIYEIARKHRIKPQTLLIQQQQLEDELTQLTERDAVLQELTTQLQAAADSYSKLAKQLSTSRSKTAKQLGTKVSRSIRKLGMPHAELQVKLISIDSTQPQANGMEHIEFYVITNPGATPQPLKKVASGGELSRISLAIQVIASQALTIPTLLFDEVDVGIGGATAETVGELLRQLGENRQVICVTHQAQVAAQATQHLHVNKRTKNNSTHTTVDLLAQPARVSEIARMIGGHKITKQTLAHAAEMLETIDN